MLIKWIDDAGNCVSEKCVDDELARAALDELFKNDAVLAEAIYEASEHFEPHRALLINTLQRVADEGGFPGPSVDEHPADHDGQCFCRTCMSYHTVDMLA